MNQEKATQEKKRRRAETGKAAKAKKNVSKQKPSSKLKKKYSGKPEIKIEKKPTKKSGGIKKTADTKKQVKKESAVSNKPVRIIPLGGIGEIGKNITLYEFDGDMFIVDCGMSFPDESTPGIDIIIPDFTYLIENKDKIKGMVLTHGHEDHIGAIPYLLKNFNIPIYGTKLTLGLVEGKLKEHGLLNMAKLVVTKAGDTVRLGKFTVELIHVNHSIPDAVALAIKCGAGTIIQTGDFKIDTTPIDNTVIDIARFAELGKEGVLALLCESTNAERAGFTASERIVGDSFATLFRKAGKHRIIVATFSSNIHRIQQIIYQAEKCGRKVAVSGRSMENVVSIAAELGYLHIPENLLIDIGSIKNYTPEQIVVVTTGSQGEPLSALHRMAFNEHRQLELIPGDMIIISATPIPGNEKTVGNVVNELMRRGANVVYEKMYDVHVSGHACQEELKLMMRITNPRYFIPVHGEQKHLVHNVQLANAVGIDKKNCIIADIGNVVEIGKSGIRVNGNVPAGRLLVDGFGVGDVGNVVLKDRIHLADDGIIIVAVTVDSVTGEVVAGPEVISRGFVFVKESEELMADMNEVACDILEKCYISGIKDWNTLKVRLRDGLTRFIRERTGRGPMVLPIVMEM
ncbi:MAG: RNase J family beta-CASP ribonuclease [Clostridia bacterium]|nr:RNase J family beta-CASP ribonuclease [Clostridia bacterium]